MRLVHYINEEKLYNFYIPKMKKDCAKFIKDIRGASGCLRRYDKKKMDWMISKHKTRDFRKTVDIPTDLSNKIGSLLKEKFGWNARTENVVFCWASKEISGFNNRYLFPVGNYKIVWSPKINDLYRRLYKLSTLKVVDYGYGSESDPKLIDNLYEYFIQNKLLDTYTDKNLKKAVVSKNEIMVNCKEYYLVDSKVIDEVDDELNLKWTFL